MRPDVILLNEFDYIKDPNQGVLQFIKGYLAKDQDGSKAIDYPYYYYGTVNTGQPSPYDLDNNGIAGKFGADAWGFGLYPGQYGWCCFRDIRLILRMCELSRISNGKICREH